MGRVIGLLEHRGTPEVALAHDVGEGFRAILVPKGNRCH
ncbi:hypothetical protein LG3211_4625 [Lysobacter gummosus]|nr:hypothetical protein LG3211_4625 [Lysobacter gummosus]